MSEPTLQEQVAGLVPEDLTDMDYDDAAEHLVIVQAMVDAIMVRDIQIKWLRTKIARVEALCDGPFPTPLKYSGTEFADGIARMRADLRATLKGDNA